MRDGSNPSVTPGGLRPQTPAKGPRTPGPRIHRGKGLRLKLQVGLLHLVSLTPVPPSGEGRVTADGWAGSQQLFQKGQKTHEMNPNP